MSDSSQKTTNLANAIRFLSIDMVNRANSGHPGAPMGMADMAVALWNEHLSFNPQNPNWTNRDRFVLSNGHASAMLYSVLHLTGYDISIKDIKNFRKLHSKTPGHPEVLDTPGVETTTGPLGQGIATAVGMALSEKVLAAQFNRPEFNIVDHNTFVFLGDGCLMEGISHEACSLAGAYKLNKLIVLYDDNGISIDGPIEPWFCDDTPTRFEAYNWNVIRDIDGHNSEAISKAITKAKKSDKPTLICCKTIIGYGAPKAGTSGVHGSPLGEEGREATAKKLGWDSKPFVVSDKIYSTFDKKEQGANQENSWNEKFAKYKAQYPKLASDFKRRVDGYLPDSFSETMNDFAIGLQATAKNDATRKSSEITLDFIGEILPELTGGSADLTGSNNTKHKTSSVFDTNTNPAGNYFSYGVREFAMSSIMNGMANYGGLIPYAGTFLVFADYARNAMRLSALMQQRVIYIMTHDSIGLGEDGPTHQPVEHLASLRIMPNMNVWRPCDGVETAVAWQCSLEKYDGPSTLALSRQGLKKPVRTDEQVASIKKGGYVLQDGSDITIIATGSEVQLAMEVADKLKQNNISVQLVSMPCYELYKIQDKPYQEQTIPSNQPRIVIEAGTTLTWEGLVAGNGFVIGMNCFGASAPAEQLFEYFGFDANMIKAQIMTFLNN